MLWARASSCRKCHLVWSRQLVASVWWWWRLIQKVDGSLHVLQWLCCLLVLHAWQACPPISCHLCHSWRVSTAALWSSALDRVKWSCLTWELSVSEGFWEQAGCLSREQSAISFWKPMILVSFSAQPVSVGLTVCFGLFRGSDLHLSFEYWLPQRGTAGWKMVPLCCVNPWSCLGLTVFLFCFLFCFSFLFCLYVENSFRQPMLQ